MAAWLPLCSWVVGQPRVGGPDCPLLLRPAQSPSPLQARVTLQAQKPAGLPGPAEALVASPENPQGPLPGSCPDLRSECPVQGQPCVNRCNAKTGPGSKGGPRAGQGRAGSLSPAAKGAPGCGEGSAPPHAQPGAPPPCTPVPRSRQAEGVYLFAFTAAKCQTHSNLFKRQFCSKR